MVSPMFPVVKNYPPVTFLCLWQRSATTGVPHASSTVNNFPPRKFTVVTFCALLTHSLLAIAKFFILCPWHTIRKPVPENPYRFPTQSRAICSNPYEISVPEKIGIELHGTPAGNRYRFSGWCVIGLRLSLIIRPTVQWMDTRRASNLICSPFTVFWDHQKKIAMRPNEIPDSGFDRPKTVLLLSTDETL